MYLCCNESQLVSYSKPLLYQIGIVELVHVALPRLTPVSLICGLNSEVGNHQRINVVVRNYTYAAIFSVEKNDNNRNITS